MFHEGWSAEVDDYAIVCGWALKGKLFIVGDVVGGLYGFEGDTGKLIWKKDEAHSGGLLAMSIHPNGEIFATSGQDGIVRILNCNNGEEIKAIKLGKGWVEHLSWSNGGLYLAVAFSKKVYVFNQDGNEQWVSEEHPSTVSAISWSNKNELATACYGRVTFFDVANKKTNQKLEWQGSLVSMQLSPDGDIVACGSQDNSVHFWRRSTGLDAEMTGYPGKPSHLSFDDSGMLLATSGSERITVWSFSGNGPEGTMPGELCHHTEPISSLAFSNKGLLVASGSRDGSVVASFLKNDGNGDPVGAAFAGDLVGDIAWRPDDCALAAINAKGVVTVWNFKVRTSSTSKGFK
jgi:WD40 repeat protein